MFRARYPKALASLNMETAKLVETLDTLKVIPVVAIENAESALPLADALVAGGLPVAEITFRTAAAADVIRTIARDRPDVLVAAGTVLDVDQLHQAVDCGATFAVAPGFDAAVVSEAIRMGFPFFPGIMTPTDIQAALGLGVRIMKFFPAGPAGGPVMLKSMAAPYLHLGVRFNPTGGVSPANLREYLEIPSVIAAGGTWIAKKDTIAQGKWDTIRDNCRQVVELVGRMKSAAAPA